MPSFLIRKGRDKNAHAEAKRNEDTQEGGKLKREAWSNQIPWHLELDFQLP